MTSAEKHNRMLCSSCKSTFDYKDATVIYKKLLGIEIPERVCPICGGTFRAIEVPGDLDQYLYVNTDNRYYTYEDKGKN